MNLLSSLLAFTARQIGALRTQADSNTSRIETSESDISDLTTTVNNTIVSNSNSKEVLWSGELYDDTITLSKNISNFDFIDIEYKQAVSSSATRKTITKRIPAVAGSYEINDFAVTYDNPSIDFFKQTLTLSATSLVAAQNYSVEAAGGSDTWTKQRGAYIFSIVRVLGVKLGSASPSELTDIRVGADGVTYNSAGAAVRGQLSDLKSELSVVESQGKYVDGIYYPAFENGTILNGVDADDAYYKKLYARSIETFSWEKTKSIVPESGITFYVVAYASDHSYIGTSAGQTATYNLSNNVFGSLPSYFRFAFRYTNSADMTKPFHLVHLTDTNNLLTRVNSLEVSAEASDEALEGNPAKYEISNGYDASGVTSEKAYHSQKRNYVSRNIVAINHDDLPAQDYKDTYKIYNKYGFNANFNFILRPFTDVAEMTEKVEGVRKLVADGNDLGLHAIMGSSFWWMNKLFDVRPNYSMTFAPSLSEVSTDVGSGKNVFGYPINSTKLFTDVGFWDIPSNYASQTVQSCSSSNYLTLIGYYTLFNSTYRMSGLDLDGVSRNWTVLAWLEHWYNRLIDDSLGYTSSGWFTDYDTGSGVGSYPDATHLINGKIVFYDDTSNPNYNDADYQKVGRFTKGLFKGCASCCNYEVEDRCIEIAKAFCLHYFGVNKFTNFGRHGVRFVDCLWYDGKTPYDDRSKTILAGEVGRVYSTRKQKFITQHDILREAGILMTNHYNPLEPIYESQIGLYYGQNGVRYPFFNHAGRISGNIGYLSLFGSSATYSSADAISLADCEKLLDGVDDVVKFAYENAGAQVTSKDGTVTKYVRTSIRDYLTNIQAARTTGKIPVFSLDTITNDASHDIAIDAFLGYCRDEGFEVVPMEKARAMALSEPTHHNGNCFPNAGFTQSLINRLGSSSNPFAYLPDGWAKYQGAVYGSTPSYEVGIENGERVFSVKSVGQGYNIVHTRIYGLEQGTYKLTFDAKRSDDKGSVMIKKQTNADLINPAFSDFDATITPTNEWATYTETIVIPAPYNIGYDGSVANQYSHGYENNVANVIIAIALSTPNVSDLSHQYSVSIKNVKLELT